MNFENGFRKSLLRPVLTGVTAVAFSLVFLFGCLPELIYHQTATTVVILLLCLLPFVVLPRLARRINSDLLYLGLLLVLSAALMLRLYLFDAASNDYEAFLHPWVTKMQSLPGVNAITTPIGDYNMPYLYFLFLLSRTRLYDLYLIKMFSVLFDLLLAFAAARLVRTLDGNENRVFTAFCIMMFLPTVFLNSAYWAQCDSIWAAFCLLALNDALSCHPTRSCVFFALAFSFKIQTVFILPILIFLWVRHKISLKDLLFFPVTFLLTLLPAIACGRAPEDTFNIYLNQTANYPELSLNCPSFWVLFPNSDFSYFGTAALFFAGGILSACGILLLRRRRELCDNRLFDIAFLCSLLMPFLLPRMHERYFYLAEALCVVYALCRRRPLAFFFCLSGFLSYGPYLFGRIPISMQQLAILCGIVIIYCIRQFIKDLSFEKKSAAKAAGEERQV